MPVPLFAITRDPLDLRELVNALADEAPAPGADGAIATFLGTVRSENLGRRVTELAYEAYEPLALRAFQQIAEEAARAWPAARLALRHRIGRLRIGEVCVAIASSAPHRADAFAACRYAIERIKQIAPIWKRESFEGGQVWIEGATADPTDEDVRREAHRRACA